MVWTGTKRGELKFLGPNMQKWAQESRFSAEQRLEQTITEISKRENGHFRGKNLEGGSAGRILRVEMVSQVTGSNFSPEKLFSQMLT